MTGHSRFKPETLFADTKDTLERLILENVELRETAADLALETEVLRESLTRAKSTKLYWSAPIARRGRGIGRYG
jgi:hypothetical protein